MGDTGSPSSQKPPLPDRLLDEEALQGMGRAGTSILIGLHKWTLPSLLPPLRKYFLATKLPEPTSPRPGLKWKCQQAGFGSRL